MKTEYIEHPIIFPVPLFRRLLAFQQAKKIALEGIILPVFEKILPKTDASVSPAFPEGYCVDTPVPDGAFASRMLRVPVSLMVRFIEYQKTKNVTIEDIIIPILDKGLPKLSESSERWVSVALFPTEYSHIDKSSAGVLLSRQFSCPFDATEFTAPGLKSKALHAKPDDFFMTEYTESIGGRPYVDYSLFEIKICPACFYANYEKGFRIFDSINNVWNEPRGLVVNDKTRNAIQHTSERRLRAAVHAGMRGHRLFSAKLSYDDALIAVALAIDSISTLIMESNDTEKAGLNYTKGLFHIQHSRMYQKLELSGSESSSFRKMRIASLRDAMRAFNAVEGTMLQDKYFQEAHEVLLYYFRKMVVAELLGDKDMFESAKTVIRKLYGDYCLGRGKGTPAEKKAATLFYNAIDEGARKFDPARVLS